MTVPLMGTHSGMDELVGVASATPLTSVAIITRNRSSSLERTLAAVTQLDYPAYEVIVVDNASTDDTASVVRRHAVQYVRGRLRDGFSGSRQRAVDMARGEIIAWCDDDCVPEPDWLKAFAERFAADEKLALLGGRVINIDFPKTLEFKGRSVMGENGVLRFVEHPAEAEFFGNLNMAMRASAVEQVGGYDPFFVGGFEEIDLAMSLREAGYRIGFESKAVVRHYHNEVSFKKGRWFFGGQLMRLYLFLKHRHPRGFREHWRFLLAETAILGSDVRKSIRAFASGCIRWNLNKIRVSAVELFNAVSARLVLPWLLLKTSRSR